MAAVRSCVCLLVVLVHLQVAESKPFFGWLLCDWMCDDDDIIASTASTRASDDFFDFDCSDCPTTGQVATPRPAQSISLSLPSIPNGVRMNVTDNNGILQFVLNAADQVSGAAPSVASPAPAGNGTAGAAPANATAAG